MADRVSSAAAPRAQAAAAPPARPAPDEVQQAVEALGRGFDGEVGIAVRDLREGWTASWRGADAFPQQSVIKIWLAVAVLDAAERGELDLDEAVVVRPEDLSLFNQPIRAIVVRDGEFRTTLGELLRRSLANSDNAATDILFRRLGGGAKVQDILDRKGVEGVRVGVQERVLQPSISGLRWRPEYSDPTTFKNAREAVPEPVRTAAWERYQRKPLDGATPVATVQALEALREGRLLRPDSTAHLLRIMFESRAGRARLKAGLEEGWSISHKTGTGPDYAGKTAGFNDVGLLTAPDGRTYAVAVYIGETGRPVPERQRLIADVARAVVAHWNASQAPKAQEQAQATPARKPAE
ncbi:MAG TPA: class A beta-lactamase [Caulobacteraceae bacterium]